MSDQPSSVTSRIPGFYRERIEERLRTMIETGIRMPRIQARPPMISASKVIRSNAKLSFLIDIQPLPRIALFLKGNLPQEEIRI